MQFSEKIEYLIKDLEAKGEKKSNAAPPLYKLFWRIGWELPPPIFASFLQNTIIQGVLFGIPWGMFMWFVLWRRQNGHLWVACLAAAFAGISFGIIMAHLWSKKNKKLGLGSWDQYPSV